MFDLDALKKETTANNRYERRLEKVVADGRQIDRIKAVVEKAVENIGSNQNSFVVYGEP